MFCRKLTWFTAGVAMIMAATAIAGPLSKPITGRTAVVLDLAVSGENDRFLASGLRQCLISHLEYYFWRNGWDAEIIESDTGIAYKNAGFESCAEITGDVNFRQSEAPLLDDSLQWPFADIEISSHLQMTIRDLTDGSVIYSGKPAIVSSRKKWLNFGAVGFDRQPLELPNLVFMRQIERLFAEMPAYGRKPTAGERQLDLEIYAEIEDPDIDLAFDYASWVFGRNFGFTLRMLKKTGIGPPSGSMENLVDVFRESVNIPESKDGPLQIIVYHATDPEKAFISQNRIQVGMADVGQRLAVITALELPNGEYNPFRPMQIGQLLVHEISHLFGAIDVADDNSIMCSYSNWVSSSQFDYLNYQIVSILTARGGWPGPIPNYLAFIAEGLERGEYTLVDFPQMFFHFQNVNDPHIISAASQAGQFGRALPYAVKGYQAYILKDFDSSRDNFYKCLALLKDSGTIHYYLSLVTTGALADFHAKKAAEAGYYPARVGCGAAPGQVSR